MSTENKFREFWIYRNEDYAPTYACDFNQRGFVPSRNKESIHVIEIAAVEQLKAENICKDLKITIQHDKITALKSKLEIAKKALEFIADDASKPIEQISGYFIGEETLAQVERALKRINEGVE